MARTEPTLRRWTRVEYERLIESGFFRPADPLELLGGALIVAEPQGSLHFTSIQLVEEALRKAFGRGWVVRVQGPIALDDESEPEPDVAVVPGQPRDYASAHPARPVLVVEVSESSLALDREMKGSLYARAGVADYWIINLVDRVVEVHRDPAPEASARYGWRYTLVRTVAPPDAVAPLAARGVSIPSADLLP
jgi:Uma2 family endonuclease